jgi:uncharacterized membrane protein (DUF4010 family)
LLGAVLLQLGGEALLAAATLGIAALLTVAYLRSGGEDPGLTTEAALLLTLLLGGLAMRRPALASGLAVTLAILLAVRTHIHRFVRSVLTEAELGDALILAASVLVVLPLMPDEYLGPFHAINPRLIWKIVVVVISISAAGYVAVRLMGVRLGLPLSGLASGFVSSAATIASMGSRAKQQPALLRPAVAGAVLSTMATIIQLAAVLAFTNRGVLVALTPALVGAGLTAVIYAAIFMIRSIRADAVETGQEGAVLSLKTGLILAGIMAGVLFASAALYASFGEAGIVVASMIAGFADAHSAAVSVVSLANTGKISVHATIVPCLAALSANTITKVVLSATAGGHRFGLQVIPGLVLVITTAWAVAFWFRW